MKMLQFIYILFIGILIAALIGVGIDAFYESPTPPEYPSESRPVTKIEGGSTELTPEEQAQQEKELQDYETEYEAFNKEQDLYNRNVSIVAMGFAVLILVGSLLIAQSADVIANGMILGGLLTLGYAIIRGFNADDPKFRFLTIVIGLIVALALGYIKFIRPMEEAQKKSTS